MEAADWNRLRQAAEFEINDVCEALAEPLRKHAQNIPVILEEAPSGELVADGIDADTLGLFVGADLCDDGSTPLPAQILIFIGNIWGFAGGNLGVYREEVRKTFLHELGHFLGLDEDEIAQRGLE